jgi:hypothetical protein
MDCPPGEFLEHHLSPIPHLNDSFRQFRGLGGYSHDVSGPTLMRIDEKIGTCQEKEMKDLVAYMRKDLRKLAQQASGGWNFGPEAPVNCFV